MKIKCTQAQKEENLRLNVTPLQCASISDIFDWPKIWSLRAKFSTWINFCRTTSISTFTLLHICCCTYREQKMEKKESVSRCCRLTKGWKTPSPFPVRVYRECAQTAYTSRSTHFLCVFVSFLHHLIDFAIFLNAPKHVYAVCTECIGIELT